MARQTRMRTKTQDGATEVLVLVSHPMETGQRTDPKTKERFRRTSSRSCPSR